MATKKLGPYVKVLKDDVAKLAQSIDLLTKHEILVGFPEDTTYREAEASDEKGPITNAALGYIHDHGAPEVGIPARPFMEPGLAEAKTEIKRHLRWAAHQALARSPSGVRKGMERAGLIAATAVKRKINEGIPPPLAESTLRERARRGRKGAKEELANRAKGDLPSTALAKPLIDTAKMRNAVTYVIRRRRKHVKSKLK